MPLVAFCDPELAAVGLSESAARALGPPVVVGKGSFSVNGRALTVERASGFVKLVVDAGNGVRPRCRRRRDRRLRADR